MPSPLELPMHNIPAADFVRCRTDRSFKKASRSAIASLTALFAYIKKDKPDIMSDDVAQSKWLTRSLRKELKDFNIAEAEKMRLNPDDKPEYADNATFTGVWNQPTTYSIVSSRQYDYRDRNNPHAYRTIIDVLYEWDRKDLPDNEYPGVRHSAPTYIFTKTEPGNSMTSTASKTNLHRQKAFVSTEFAATERSPELSFPFV